MQDNPFASQTFKDTWVKYFYPSKKGNLFTIEGISYVQFIKKTGLPIYFNVGKNLTNGIFYEKNNQSKIKLGKKCLLLHDVPSYFNVDFQQQSDLKLLKSPQYSGFLSKLEDESFEELMKKQFKSNSRYKFRRSFERMEICFNIKYSNYYGAIDKNEYDSIMKQFHDLIKKRFDGLKKDNDVIAVWDYYTELVYPMILEKKAHLICIWKDSELLGVSLSFLSKEILFYAVTSFNSDYKRYILGHLLIHKLMEWCFENNISIYDFSKGENEYKSRWTNLEYKYEVHILYNPKNMVSLINGKCLFYFYQLKQKLRDKNINDLMVKIKYLFKNWSAKTIISPSFSIQDLANIEVDDFKIVSKDSATYDTLKPIIYDKLFQFPEPENDLILHKSSIDEKTFFVQGKQNRYLISYD